MLSNVLEVLAVLHKDVGKAGNRPADVDDGEDDDGDLGTKILSSFRPCAIFIPTPACPPSGLGSAVSETEEDMVTDRIRSSKTVKTYRRANDDEDADGQEGEVDDWLRGCRFWALSHFLSITNAIYGPNAVSGLSAVIFLHYIVMRCRYLKTQI